MNKLINKIALVTGASEGIGLAIAQAFLEEGAEHVFITGRRHEMLEQAVKTMNRTNVTVVQGDVANVDDLDRLFTIVRRSKNRLDILVANAGISNIASLSTLTEQHYDDIFNVNVKGVFFTVQKALPLLTNGSSVILIGSVSSIKGHPTASVYSASKATIRAFTRCWSNSLKERNIRVNTLSPGSIDTSMFRSVVESNTTNSTFMDDFLRSIPLNRLGHCKEVANTAVFLASDDSSYITGIELFVDGGRGQI